MSDSVHDFGDALSIGVSYFLERKSKKRPDSNHTYGYIRYSVVGSVITTVILIVGSIFVIYESIKRIINPVDINDDGMLIIALFGVVVNLIASYVTREGHSLNQKAVNLHMLEDVLGWVLVLIGSILIRFTNISLIDPILSIVVALFILYHALKNFKTVIDLFLETTPHNISIKDIKKHVEEIDGVVDVHHVHIRSMDGYNNYATMHVVVKKYSEDIKHKIKEELEEHGISHSTIELELENENCENKVCSVKNVELIHHHHH